MRAYTGPGGGTLDRPYQHLPIEAPPLPYFIQHWRHEVLGRWHDACRTALAEHLAGELHRRDLEHAHRETTQWLVAMDRRLKSERVNVAFDDLFIIERAEFYASLCRQMGPAEDDGSCDPPGALAALARRVALANGMGIEVCATRAIRFSGIAARMNDPRWWRRQLRKAWTRASETTLRDLGLIARHASPYVSLDGMRFRDAQRRRSIEYLKSRTVVNEEGVQLSLFDVAQASIANPKIRRGELMTRARGFEAIAQMYGHVALFITATAPSAYHASRTDGRNPRFEGFTPRQAQSWLCRIWARARAKLKRKKVESYGIRVAEPHHDGTPHWHMLLFMAQTHVELMCQILTEYWLSEYADEPGAREVRIKFETIDPAKGSAVGYLAKYVAKNIDGEGSIGAAESDEAEGTVAESLTRVDAWASLHGIRQFQQIGGVPVGIWRELRRLRDAVPDPDIERARRCADRGDWCMYTLAITCNDPFAGRKTALKLERESRRELNHFREPKIARVIGVRYCSSVVITRPSKWRIEKRECRDRSQSKPPIFPGIGSGVLSSDSSLGPVEITVRAPLAGDPVPVARPELQHRPEGCPWCDEERQCPANRLLIPPKSRPARPAAG